MIYFDNSATTMIKPDSVKEAVINSLGNLGNAGRGANSGSLSADRIIFNCRENLAELFKVKNSRNIAFTSGATESLNIAINGIINPTDHVITSRAEHNSVLRPLYRLEKEGCQLSFIDLDEKGDLILEDLESLLKGNTRAVIVTQVSNLTGNRTDLKRISAFCKKHGLILIVDASQSAGAFDIDVEGDGIDVLCFTGHKGLFGLQGTGGIYVNPDIDIRSIKVGGSGIHTFDREHPQAMPTRLEAGTLNGHGIAGLSKGVEYILSEGPGNIHRKEMEIARRFYEGLKDIEGIRFLGNYDTDDRAPIVTFTYRDINSSELGMEIMDRIDVAFRTGGHCAPLVHEHFKTVESGALRFSFSVFNTKEEVDEVLKVIKEILFELSQNEI